MINVNGYPNTMKGELNVAVQSYYMKLNSIVHIVLQLRVHNLFVDIF